MNIHFSEILVILIIALLVIKPERLPGIALKLGKGYRWLKLQITQFKRELGPHE